MGLGNPGPRYARTRHNVGWRAVEAWVAGAGARWSEARTGRGLTAAVELPDGRRLWAVQPHTFMNASGEMVAPLARYHRVAPAELLVVGDDFSLPLGRLRIRARGSAGGQKGLESVLRELASSEVPRLRLGIGPIPAGADPADFVLAGFLPEEREAADAMVGRAAEAISGLLDSGLEAAMNAVNRSAA